MNDIAVRSVGSIGHITLTRPQALNALTHPMVIELENAMQQWEASDRIAALLIDADGDRAFCAGGDIVDIYRQGVQGSTELALQFWRDEYRVNAAIADYRKPYIAVMDGIVMGGGAGIACHGSHRIVTERTVFAMPECAIGLIPDVGGSFFLGQCPGHCGEYVGLTGARLSGADCIYAGLADYHVPSDTLKDLKNAIFESGDVGVISRFATTPDSSQLEQHRAEIDALFSAGTIDDIKTGLQTSQTDFARSALAGFNRGAPLCLTAALKLIRAGRSDADLLLALRNEYRFVSHAVSQGEFIEGVRAAVIDKDRQPRWKYPTLQDVPAAVIDGLDQPAPDGDWSGMQHGRMSVSKP